MPLADSRLGPGTLTLATFDHSFQIANVALEPDVSDEDGTPTLAVPEPAPLATVAWALTGTAIQDFELPAGFVNYCMDNALAEVAFEWVPNTAYGLLKYAGTCQVRPVTVGGDVAVQITTDFSFPCIGEPVRTDAAARAAAGSKS
jgi:hypothetical protein